MNPQSENETLKLFEDVQKHPDIWLMMRQQELEIFRRRWFEFPHQNGRAEIFFRLVQEHLNLTCNALFLLRQEREDKAQQRAVALRYVKPATVSPGNDIGCQR